VSYGCRNLDWFAESGNLGRLHLLARIRFLAKFCRDLPETLYMKNSVNKLSFLLVTHMTCFDTWFGRYRFFKSGYSTDQILDRLNIHVLYQVFGPQELQNLLGFEYMF
jgi:hypothetical protein